MSLQKSIQRENGIDLNSHTRIVNEKKYLEKSAKFFNEKIPIFLQNSCPEELYLAMHHLLDAGGKRLRPAAMILAAEAVGGKTENVLPAAIAIELIHNFTLIHDDIMDEAEIRRSVQTVHKKWGVPKAIIAGDALYSRAIEVISLSKSEPSKILESINLLSHSCVEVCEGQWMDMDFKNKFDVSEDEYLKMVEKKTAILFATAMKIGAVLSGANKDISKALWDFGRLAGIGFQIYDDVIDLITPEVISGKAQGSDIIEGKNTLIIIHAHSKGVTIDALGKSNASKSDVSRALMELRRSGSIDYAMNKALNFVDESKSALDILPDSEAKKVLIGFADLMINRKF